MKSVNDTIYGKFVAFCEEVEKTSKSSFDEIGIDVNNYTTMRLIFENPGISVINLANMKCENCNIFINKIDMLEKKKFVQRIDVGEDFRAHSLHLTSMGKNIVVNHWDVFLNEEINRIEKLENEEWTCLLGSYI